MEQFYLEKPSIERKNEIIEYIDEFIKYKSNIAGIGSLEKISEGYTFEQALERCLSMKNKEYAEKVNRCPGKTFLLVRENDSKVVGTINLRWDLNETMLQFGGHIGYGIRPTERRSVSHSKNSSVPGIGRLFSSTSARVIPSTRSFPFMSTTV